MNIRYKRRQSHLSEPKVSPLQLFTTVLLIIFFAETIIMIVFNWLLPDIHGWIEAFLDGSLLTVLGAPFLWWTIVRPLRTLAMTEQAKAKAIVDTAADAIITINQHGLISSFNPAATRIFGYERIEVIGQNIKMLMPYTQQTQIIGIHSHEAVAQHKNGTTFPVELTLSEMNANGERSFIGIMRDITDRKQAEQTLQAYASKLERNNRELVEFIHIASHDLQEPLRKVQAFGSRLQSQYERVLDEAGQNYLGRMLSATRRMQTLINGLLDYSRVTTKARPFESVDLAQIAAEVLSDREMQLQNVNGRVEINDLPTLQADPCQMRQLLQNLIDNALKFNNPEKALKVRVFGRYWAGSTELSTRSGSESCFYEISVVDNGIGFDEKYADRIFGVFQRLHGRSEYEGTGIGLAICKKIAERHGGNIEAKSVPGQGATFVVTLPIKQAKEEPSE